MTDTFTPTNLFISRSQSLTKYYEAGFMILLWTLLFGVFAFFYTGLSQLVQLGQMPL